MQSDRKQKAENFRRNIRREELDTYFQERRAEILQVIQQEQVREITLQLQTNQQRQKLLQNAALDLCGIPKIEWLPIIKNLRKVLIVFGGQFHLWISKSIIRNLCLAFKQQYKQVGLADEISSLLIDMAYLSFEVNSKFVAHLMEYEIVGDVLALASDKYRTLDSKIHCLMLLAKIAGFSSNYRDSILRDGGGFILVEIGKEILSLVQVNQKTITKYLEVTYSFCQFYNNHNFSRVVSISNPVSQIVINFMCAQQASQKVLSLCLSTINALLKLQKMPIARNIYFNNKFLSKGLSLYYHPQVSIRTKISITFCFFTNFEQYSKDLLQKGILDYIYTAYEKLQQKKNPTFMRGALYTISNMAESQYQAEMMSRHRVFEMAIQEIASQSSNIEAAFFCLNSILMQLKYFKIQELIKKYDILKYMVQVLIDSIYSHSLYIQVLVALIAIIKKSLEVYYLQNPIIAKLEGLYNISIVVENIRCNIKNKIIAQKADQLIQLIQNNLHNSYSNTHSL